jgi:hypothetical protein
LEEVVLEVHSLRLLELQDQFQHFNVLHQLVVEVVDQMLVLDPLLILLELLVQVVVAPLLREILQEQVEQVIHLPQILFKDMPEVILLMTLEVVEVVLLLLV